jgi:adenylosuccinate synthase
LCSVVLDLHQKLDGLEEALLGGGKIGTTGKGIGPCYSSKMSRNGITLAMIFQEELFAEKVRNLA